MSFALEEHGKSGKDGCFGQGARWESEVLLNATRGPLHRFSTLYECRVSDHLKC